jgi:hypothetical protein
LLFNPSFISGTRRLTPKPRLARVLFRIENYRLRDWLTRFIPYEIGWLRAPWSKGKRKKQIRAYLDALDYIMGRRYSPDKPFPGLELSSDNNAEL